jgi:xylan 1,4-beta-xylosidase
MNNDRSRSGRVVLVRRSGGQDVELGAVAVPSAARQSKTWLRVEAHGQEYSFSCATEADHWHSVAADVDGRILSTTVAGGFTGAYIGPYASSQGKQSTAVADFDWFEYQPGVDDAGKSYPRM